MIKVISHPHAERMKQYAEDAAEMLEPWSRWEYKSEFTPYWRPCTGHPGWHLETEYRRKSAGSNDVVVV